MYDENNMTNSEAGSTNQQNLESTNSYSANSYTSDAYGANAQSANYTNASGAQAGANNTTNSTPNVASTPAYTTGDVSYTSPSYTTGTYSTGATSNTTGGYTSGATTTSSTSTGGYQPHFSAQPNASGINTPHRQTEAPRKAKKSSFASKVAMLLASALVFGVVAGCAMFGVSSVMNTFSGTKTSAIEPTTQASVQATIPETTAAVTTTIGNQTTTSSTTSAIVMDASSIVEKAMPSIVAIDGVSETTYNTWFGRQTYEGTSNGSGIIIGENDTEYLVVTNNHVVSDTKSLKVTFIDDTSVDATVKGRDSDVDIAIIAINKADVSEETKAQISIASIGDSDSLKVGQGVIAIGNALGYGQSVTVGCISALNRDVETDDGTQTGLLQTDAAINPGNSGGALLDINGNVIGINVAKYSSTQVEGMGYAIPISKVTEVIASLSTLETRTEVAEESRGYIGIQGQTVSSDISSVYGIPEGVYVYKILEDGGAVNSDLQEKDIITKVNGQTVKTMEELKSILATYAGGETITLSVMRMQNNAYTQLDVSVTLKTQAESNMYSTTPQ